jgi:hypothetical protein
MPLPLAERLIVRASRLWHDRSESFFHGGVQAADSVEA